MKAKTPYNIWVYNRADGVTTFGEYVRAKRRVFLECKTKDELHFLQHQISGFFAQTKRPIQFKGDPLPLGWQTTIRYNLPQEMFV